MRRVVLAVGASIVVALLVSWQVARKAERPPRLPRGAPPSGEQPAAPVRVDRAETSSASSPISTPQQGEKRSPPIGQIPGGLGRPVIPDGNSPPPTLTPETRMHFVRSMLQDYRNVYRQNPIGSNAEIAAALMGKNARRSQFLRADDRNLNERGELIDYWGSPYFLHQISGQIMEIRSAGPDKTMWTADDLTVK